MRQTRMPEASPLRPAMVIAGGVAGLAVVRALGSAGVPVIVLYHDVHDVGRASRHAAASIRVPHPEHAEKEFVDNLLAIGPRHAGALLLPTSDEAVKTLGRHKRALERHYAVGCVDWEVSERFIDKRHTYELAERLGVPAPRTVVPGSVDDLEAARDMLQFPCLVKPRESHRYVEVFGRKMVKVHNYGEMLEAFREADDSHLEVLIQEFIPGGDAAGVNYNAYCQDGRPLAACTAQKLRLSPPEMGRPRVLISRHVPEIAEPATALLGEMGVEGFSCTEFKWDRRDATYKLMEINGRPNHSTALSVRCGMNFPAMTYRHLIEGELPSDSRYETGVYWIDEVADVARSVSSRRTERYPLRDYLRPYVRPRVLATFDRRDPAPLAARCIGIGVRALERVKPGRRSR